MLASALLAAAPRAQAQQEGVATFSPDGTVWTLTGPTVVTEGSVAEYTVRRTAGDAPLEVHVGAAAGSAGLALFPWRPCNVDACLELPSGARWRSGGSSYDYSLGALSLDGHVMRVTIRQDNQIDPDETLRVGFNTIHSAASSDWSFTVTIRNGDRDGTVTIKRRTTANASTWDLGQTLTASLTDPDGIVSGSVRWQWQRNPAPDLSQDWADIAGATSKTYVPGRGDMETGLRARASYDDQDGTGKSATHPGRPVQGICGRTPVVQDAIRGRIPGSPRCEDVRLSHLAAIDTRLDFVDSVDTLRDFDFFGLSGLRGLTIRNPRRDGLSTLPTQALAGLDSLVTLTLSENRLTELDPEWFRDLGMLENLALNHNSLTVLPPGVFVSIPDVATLSLHQNRRLGSLPADTFDAVTALDTLDLRWIGWSGGLPEGFFLGHHHLNNVRLYNNPGTTSDPDDPLRFKLTVRLERSDSLPWTAPGPATVSVRIAEGAPGPITATLRASGDLSAQTAVIPGGEEASGPVTLTPSAGETHARVFIDSILEISPPEIACITRSPCYGGGIGLAKGNADLALPAVTVPDQTWTAGTPVSLLLPLPVGGDGTLTHAITPPLPEGVTLDGREISGTPQTARPAQAHEWTATDSTPTGSVTLTFSVTVDPGVPAPPENLQAIGGIEQVTLEWDAGSDRGATIDLWQHRMSDDDGGIWTEWADIPGGGAIGAHTVTGLAAGPTRVFEVRAHNSVGFSPAAQATASPVVEDIRPTFGGAVVDDQAWVVGTPVSLALPEAKSGNPPLVSVLAPVLPAGVSIVGHNVSGTPSAVTAGREHTWTFTDADGDAVSLAFRIAVAPGRPGAPIDFRTSDGLDRQAGLSWGPGPDNGAPIDLWQFRVSNDNGGSWTEWAPIPGGGAARAHTATGLSAVLNTIELRARNSAGFGPAATVTVTPVELNTTPTFGGASVDDQNWTVGTPVSLVLPEPTGGNLPYRHMINPPLPADVELTDRTVSGTPLATAAAQAHTLTATDADGDAVSLIFTVAVVPGVPGAPASLSATAGTLEVTLDWDAGPANGAAITLWQYRVSDADGGGWSPWAEIPGGAAARARTVTGLAANIGRTFGVRARNSVGPGPAATATATPLNTPPTFGTVTVANQDWTVGTAVSLDLPEASEGNGALTYSLSPAPPANVTRNGRTVSGTPAATAPGQEYTWTATDARGASVSLTFTITVSPGVPGAPANLSATAGALEVTLGWDAGPANGAAITLWQYRVSDADGGGWSPWAEIPGGAAARAHTATGLAANTERTFGVRALNSAGAGPAATATATPLNTPPSFGTATVADQDWTVGTAVSLELPEASGGNGALAYSLSPAPPANVTRNGRTVSGTPMAVSAGQQYTWTATDARGDTGSLTFTVAVSPGVPGAPVDFDASSGLDRRAGLSWSPGADNGAPIDRWQFRVSDDNGGSWTDWADIPGGGGARAHTATGLAPVLNTIELRAHNSAGFGPAAQATTTPVELDTVPTFGGASVADQDWTVGTPVSLVLPEPTGGNLPYSHAINPPLPAGVELSGRTVSGTPMATAAAQTHTLTATDADGDAVSLSFTVAVVPGVPGAPANLSATAGTLEVTLDWDAGPANGAAITRWEYRVGDAAGGGWSPWTPIPGGAAARAHTATGLAANTERTFGVRALNSAGPGPVATVAATPLNTPPSFGTATVADQDWTVGTAVSLDLPEASAGNGALTYSLSPALLPANVTRNGRTVSGTPVAAATGREYTWTATDAASASVALTFTIAVSPGVPGTPADFQASSGLDRRARLSWNPGPDNGALIDLWQFRVSNDNGGSWTEWAEIPGGAAARAHTVTGLAPVLNTIELRARNSAGFGPAAQATAMPVELDTDPTFGEASVADQDWTVGTAVSLVLPDPSGGNLPYSHMINPPLPADVELTGRTVSGTPLATAAAQTHTLTATDADGDAVSLSFTVAVSPGVPGAPVNLSATAGTLEVTLDWDAGLENGAAITLWQYRVSDAGGGWSPWEPIPGDAAARAHTVTGLAANIGRTFEVRARNSVGFGPAASAAATPLKTPPSFGSATVANQDWTVGTAVSLDLPEASGGNGALTYSLDPELPADVTRNGQTVSGTPTVAAAGQQYTWTATDADLDAVSLTFTVAVHPDVPGAPANLSATAGTLEVTLDWDAGPDNGAAIDFWQYRVSVSGGAGWAPDWTTIPGSDAGTDTHTVTGLAANVGHTFQVRASNSVGFGPAAGAAATPLEVDTQPTFGAATVADQDWTVGTAVSLELPEASGGNGALTYSLDPALPANVTRNGRTVSGTPTVAATGQEYAWTATDADGDAVSLTFPVAVAPDFPGAPENLVATAGTLEVTLGWDTGPDNGATIEFWQYRVSVSGGDGWSPDWETIPGSDADTDTHTVTGLAANVGRTFQVRASNSAGFGPAASAAATPLNTPPTFGAEAVDDQDWTVGTAVSLDLPEASGGNGALTYSLDPELPADVTRNGRTVSGTPAAPAAGQQYTWTATDGGGDAASLTFTVAAAPGVPGAPASLSATAGTLEVTLNWSAGPDNGATIDLWQYRVSVSGGGTPDWVAVPASGAGTDTHTVTGLAANTGHTFQVRARNRAGFGLPATAAAMPSVNLRLLPRVANDPAARFGGDDALLIFYFTQFHGLLSRPANAGLSRIIVRGLSRGTPLSDAEADGIIAAAAALGMPGGIPASHPANLYDVDPFNSDDALLLFYSIQFGSLLTRPALADLMEIVVNGVLPRGHGIDRDGMRALVMAGMRLADT